MAMRMNDWEHLLSERKSARKSLMQVVEHLGIAKAAHFVVNTAFELRNAVGLQNLIRITSHDRVCYQLHSVMDASQSVLTEFESLSKGERILFPHMRGSYYLELFEIFMAFRLRYEGYRPVFLACGGLPICNNYTLGQDRERMPWRCWHCLRLQRQLLKASGLPFEVAPPSEVSKPSLIEAQTRTEDLSVRACYETVYHDVPIGQLIEPSVARHLRRSALNADTLEEIKTWQSYLASAYMLVDAYEKALDTIRPDIVFLPGGWFLWYSIALYLARQRGIQVFCYENAFHHPPSGKRWMFTQNTSFLDPDCLSPAWEQWRDVPLTEKENEHLDQVLSARKGGSLYYPLPVDDQRRVREELGLVDAERPVVALFTNMTWDAAVYGKGDTPFESMLDWVIETIRSLAPRDVTLVVRAHPAEALIHEGVFSRENLIPFVKNLLGDLPDNVKMVPPESKISSYTLLDMVDTAVMYTSTLGLEAAVAGRVPLIIAGPARYGHNGFGHCPTSFQEYFDLLLRADSLAPPSPHERELARRFAYMYFFRTAWPVQFFESGEGGYLSIDRMMVNSLKDIRPGKDPLLDSLAQKIHQGSNSLLVPRALETFLS